MVDPVVVVPAGVRDAKNDPCSSTQPRVYLTYPAPSNTVA